MAISPGEASGAGSSGGHSGRKFLNPAHEEAANAVLSIVGAA